MMGYVKEMKLTFEQIMNGPSKDDQRNLNIACKHLPYIKIDTKHIIFENCNNINAVNDSQAYICQIPATPSFHRLFRSFWEYSYFVIEILLLISLFVLLSWLLTAFNAVVSIMSKL